MKDFIQIALFTAVISLVYTGVGQLLPQIENRPPADVKLGSKVSPDELAVAGAAVFETVCVQCHKLGESGRAPDLSGIGMRAQGRAVERKQATGKAFTDVDYLLEAVCKPGDYIVDGFGNIMPPQDKALSGGQILAVVAFLQNLGGEASVQGTDVDPVKRFCKVGGGGGAAAGEPAKEAAAGGGGSAGTPEAVFGKFGCSGCHSIDSDEKKIGPALFGVGKRLTKGAIYESILSPDAKIAEGFSAGVMKKTLDGNGFYQQMTPADYQGLVDWLAKNKGE